MSPSGIILTHGRIAMHAIKETNKGKRNNGQRAKIRREIEDHEFGEILRKDLPEIIREAAAMAKDMRI
jgi:hypothetical protein